MFDPRQEAREFYGSDETTARTAAQSHFGCDEGELVIRRVEEVHGLGARTVVVARPAGAPSPSPSSRARGADGRDRSRSRPPAGDRRGQPPRSATRGGQEDGRGAQAPPAAARGGQQDGRGAPAPREPEPTEPSVGVAEGEIGEVGAYILGVLERMGLGPFTISMQSRDRFLVFRVTGPATQLLTAGDARAPGAIQLLANQAAGMLLEDAPRVVVDIEGDREKREAFLARVADRAARRARETGRPVALDPMNGRDRRGIHLALREVAGVASMGIGEGAYRQVLIVPEGAAEYEEAVAATEQADASPGPHEGEARG